LTKFCAFGSDTFDDLATVEVKVRQLSMYRYRGPDKPPIRMADAKREKADSELYNAINR
jgi:hypothetical protein